MGSSSSSSSGAHNLYFLSEKDKLLLLNARMLEALVLSAPITLASVGRAAGVVGGAFLAVIPVVGPGLAVGVTGSLLTAQRGKFKHTAFRFKILSGGEVFYMYAHLTDNNGIEIYLSDSIRNRIVTPNPDDVNSLAFTCIKTVK